jgi:hypothetical protein
MYSLPSEREKPMRLRAIPRMLFVISDVIRYLALAECGGPYSAL